jgi:hypothetical protein
MIQVDKQYGKAFLVEPTKLGRLLDTIHECLTAQENATLDDTFEVFLTGHRHEAMTKLDEVLGLDNSRKHKITRLSITCSASSAGATQPEHEVRVDFGQPIPSSPGSPSGSGGNVVTVSVRGEGVGWANRTLGVVEEQVERNWLRHGPYVGLLIGLFTVALLLLASQFVDLRAANNSSWWLTSSDRHRVEAMLAQHPVLTDQDLREVSTMQLRNVLAWNALRPPRQAPPNRTRRTLFWAVPLLVLIACTVILLTTCYPKAVFFWGDGVERYENAKHRRTIVWGIIISATVAGVASNFFFVNATSLISH